jgi:hypothetical protein
LSTHQTGPYLNIYTVSYVLSIVCWMPVLLPIFDRGHFPSDGEGAQLSWLRRMKIAIGIARGLKYLHTELQPPFAISELNSNSVYVTEDFTPKVSHAMDSAAPDCIHSVLEK